MVALGRVQHSRRHDVDPGGCRRPRVRQDAEGRCAVAHRLRQAGLRRTVPAAGRQAASLHHYCLRAQGRQAVRRRRELRRSDGRIHDESERARQGDVDGRLRAQVSVALPALSLLETRVLGVLVEKQHTVPDTYPLTLNALVAGCNQKTSRDPIVNATEAEVQATIDRLRALSLIVESSGGRVMRYAHNIERVLGVPPQSVAILATMMLRGPQTVAELRANCERLHRFADASAAEGFL